MSTATARTTLLVCITAMAGLAVVVALHALALECPAMPQQTQRDWDVAVALAVGRVGAASGPQLQVQTRAATPDLLKRLPNADRVYLEQMMYATYCSTLRDNGALTEAERDARIQACNRELRATLAASSRPATLTPDARDAARAELERLPLPYSTDAFIETARTGRLPALPLFLQAGIDANATDRRGATALMYASGRGDLPMMDTLLKASSKADMRMPSPGDKGASALSWAADVGRKRGWNVGARQNTGQTALTQAATTNHPGLARLLLKAGADANQRCECSGIYGGNHTPLTLATVSSDSGETTMQLLLEAGARVDDASADGTPLVQATRRGSLARVRLLLAHGADPGRARDAGGDTALMQAVKATANVEMLQALLAAGADVNAPGGSGVTALIWAAELDQTHVAALLLDAGARIEHATQIGRTALMVAAMSGSVNTARLLLQRGAPTEAVDQDLRSALALAEARLKGDTLLRMRSLLTQPKELR